MASEPTFSGTELQQAKKVGVLRLGFAAGATAGIVYVLCWLGTFVPLSSPTHGYITLFTTALPGSIQALVEGTFWSLLFGALSGALFAVIYNAMPAPRRSYRKTQS